MRAGFDLLIRGGEVVDGTGRPRFRADIGVAGDRIVAAGDSSAGVACPRLPGHDHPDSAQPEDGVRFVVGDRKPFGPCQRVPELARLEVVFGRLGTLVEGLIAEITAPW